MRIIIIGVGKVGYQIAETLAREKYNIVAIDKDDQVIRRVDENLDVLAICSNGLAAQTLRQLDVNENDLLVAVTDSDEGNILACISAKNLGGCTTVARIRNPEYANDLAVSPHQLSIDIIVNPEKSTAEDINRMLMFSPAGKVEEFAKGAVQMVALSIDKGVGFVTESLSDIGKRGRVLIAAIVRGEELIVPKGRDFIIEGDTIYIVGRKEEIMKFCRSLGKNPVRMSNAMLLGGSRIAYYLAEILRRRNVFVKIIEREISRCRELSQILPGVLIINGDGSDINLLQNENIDKMDAFVGLTGIDEENILISLLAKRIGAKKAIAKVGKVNYIPLAETIGIDGAISPAMITAGKILRFIQGEEIISLFLLLGGKAEIVELNAHPQSRGLGIKIKDLNFPQEAIIASIIRKGKVIIPVGNDVVKGNDRLVILSKANVVNEAKDLFLDKKGGLHGYRTGR